MFSFNFSGKENSDEKKISYLYDEQNQSSRKGFIQIDLQQQKLKKHNQTSRFPSSKYYPQEELKRRLSELNQSREPFQSKFFITQLASSNANKKRGEMYYIQYRLNQNKTKHLFLESADVVKQSCQFHSIIYEKKATRKLVVNVLRGHKEKNIIAIRTNKYWTKIKGNLSKWVWYHIV